MVSVQKKPKVAYGLHSSSPPSPFSTIFDDTRTEFPTIRSIYRFVNWMQTDFPSSHSQSNDIVVAISLMMQVLHATVTPLYYASNTIKQTKTQFKSKSMSYCDGSIHGCAAKAEAMFNTKCQFLKGILSTTEKGFMSVLHPAENNQCLNGPDLLLGSFNLILF